VIEGGEQLRFTTEARDAAGVGGERVRQNLQRDISVQPRIASAIHLSHSAGADRRNDLVDVDACSAGEAHLVGLRIPPPRPDTKPAEEEHIRVAVDRTEFVPRYSLTVRSTRRPSATAVSRTVRVLLSTAVPSADPSVPRATLEGASQGGVRPFSDSNPETSAAWVACRYGKDWRAVWDDFRN